MQRRFEFGVGEYYHLYNRGVEKRKIFSDRKCWTRFMTLLHVCNNKSPVVFKEIQGLPLDKIEVEERVVAIGAYCLMPNHFHILVREIVEGGISRFMEKLLTAYSMYFNKRYDRTGRLFENNYRARHVRNENYLRCLYAYIHLNPVKLIEPNWRKQGIRNRARADRFLSSYSMSSFPDYIREEVRPERVIINRSEFPEYFQKPLEFSNFLDDWINYQYQGLPLDLEKI